MRKLSIQYDADTCLMRNGRLNAVQRGSMCVWLAAIALSITGCNDGRPERVPVAGTVTIDGKPLALAFVNFYPASGRPSSGRTDESGRFVLRCFEDSDGAQLSTHEVTVTAVQQVNATTMRWNAPKKYSRVDTAGLSYTIDQPVDDLKIELS